MSEQNPVVVQNPASQADSAVVFVHGFTGKGTGTWGSFPELFATQPELSRFDAFFWQYPSSLNLKYAVTKWFWENDPNIPTVGNALRTLLEETLSAEGEYSEIKLIAHSMGGLVVQSYLLEELRRIREGTKAVQDSAIGRINEVMLFASPSGGLAKARFGSFLKNQIADMSDLGPFITNLRSEWSSEVDGHRHSANAISGFRLTTVAGMQDRFVPPESALEPFPFDDHQMVPGNHVELVKPESVGRGPADLVTNRVTRDTPTGEELEYVYGRSAEAVAAMQLVEAAVELGDAASLHELADGRLRSDQRLPAVERALGLALGRQSDHELAVELLERYLGFELKDGSRPFARDVQVIQQLAVAQSGLRHHTAALATLKSLPAFAQESPESLGIEAGRIKRAWRESGPPRPVALARRALNTYRAGYEAAIDLKDPKQIAFTGINLAFMSLAVGEPHEEVAEAVLAAVADDEDDYWLAATRGEAMLLLGKFEEAVAEYSRSLSLTMSPRYLASTAIQALLAIELLGRPSGSEAIVQLVEGNIGSEASLPEVAASVEDDLDE